MESTYCSVRASHGDLESTSRRSDGGEGPELGAQRRSRDVWGLRRHAGFIAAILLLGIASTPMHVAAQINAEDTEDWVVTLGRQPLRAMLGSDAPILAPNFALGPALPFGRAPVPPADPPQTVASQTIAARVQDSNVAVTQNAVAQAFSPAACAIQLVDFNLLTPDMLSGCTHMPEAALKQSPYMAGTQLCRMRPTFGPLAFTTKSNATMPWLVIDMVMTNGMGGTYCALRNGSITPQGGVNGSCTLLQTTWIQNDAYNSSNLAEGPKVIRPIALNTTFTLHQLTAIVQAPGVIVSGIRDDDTTVSKQLKQLGEDGTTITKFNPVLWTNLQSIEFAPVQAPSNNTFLNLQMFKMQVSFC